jgi:hypothetical protein
MYATEYYSAIMKNGIVSLPRKWVKLEIIMLSKITRLKKTQAACFLSYTESISKEKKDTNIKG